MKLTDCYGGLMLGTHCPLCGFEWMKKKAASEHYHCPMMLSYLVGIGIAFKRMITDEDYIYWLFSYWTNELLSCKLHIGGNVIDADCIPLNISNEKLSLYLTFS